MSYNPTSVNGDQNWLDASSTSNRYIRTYIKGFVDVSGGNVIIRPGNHLFLKGGDISLNGNIYANYPTGSIPVTAISGLNGSGTTSLNSIALVNTVADSVTFTDNSFALYKPNPQYGTGTVTFQTSDLSLNGNLRIGGNLITSVVQLGPLSVTGTAPILTPQTDTEGFSVCAVNTNQQTFTYAANDLSVNGNLFVRSFGRDLSMNGNVSLGGNLLVNGNLSVNQFQSTTKITTTNYQLVVAEDLSLNGRLNVTQDASFNGNVYVKGNLMVAGGITPMYTTPSFTSAQVGYIVSGTVTPSLTTIPTSQTTLFSLTIPCSGVWLMFSNIVVYYGGVNTVNIGIYDNTAGYLTFVNGTSSNQQPGFLTGSISNGISCFVQAVYNTSSSRNMTISAVTGSVSVTFNASQSAFTAVRIA